MNLIFNAKARNFPCFAFSDIEKKVYAQMTDIYVNANGEVIEININKFSKKLKISKSRLIKIINKFKRYSFVRDENAPEQKAVTHKNYFVLPNEILDGNLTVRSIIILSYLYSLPCNGKIKIRQSKIAQVCNLDIKTVRKHINILAEKGFITDIKKSHKHEFEVLTYTLKPLPESGYFFVPRAVFSRGLEPKLFTMYLLHCRAEDVKSGIHWNSYNDILAKASEIFRVARSVIISLIKKLADMKLIIKYNQKVKTCNGKASLVDNMYCVLKTVANKIKKSMKKITSFDILFLEFLTELRRLEKRRDKMEKLYTKSRQFSLFSLNDGVG
jgi:predicted transcriptional regulator